MKVLVTGGAGYIGSHTCKALAKQGYSPVSYDNLSRGHRSAVKWGPMIQGDLLETEKLTKVLKEEKIQAVLHFAAVAYVGESVLDPLRYYRNNVLGSMSLLEAMKNAGVPEDFSIGWVIKALEDLKAQGVTEIKNIPWNGANIK